MRKRRPVSGGAVLEFEITIGTRKENQLLCYKAIFQLLKEMTTVNFLQIKLIMLDIHLQTSITMSQAHQQNFFGNTRNIIFNQRFESLF